MPYSIKSQPSVSCFRFLPLAWITLAGFLANSSFAATASDLEVSEQKALEILSKRVKVTTPAFKSCRANRN